MRPIPARFTGDKMEIILGIFVVFVAGIFAYGSFHVAEEQRQGKRIPLIWERKKRKIFDKSDIEYRDGDNT